MNKILLIIKREYLTRVRKRTFIISTVLFPLLYLLLIFGTGYIAEKSKPDLKVALIDRSGLIREELVDKANKTDSSCTLTLVKNNTDSIITGFDSRGYDAYIVVPEHANWKKGIDSLQLNTHKTFGIGVIVPIQSKLNRIWNEIKNDSLGIDESKKIILATSTISLKINNSMNRNADAGTATVIGYVCGFLMYIILLLYGSQVMMGVMEEKTNRIAEVMISSVKSFQLMMGKIIGIGAVALTQFLIWIACILLIYIIGKYSGNNSGMMAGAVVQIQKAFTSVDLPLVVGCFIFYMLAGFFFYSSLYGAIGSAINEDMREAQSLSFPITMLIIFSIALMSSAISNPGSLLSLWASIVPFSSPIVMMARIPFGVPNTVPWWQLGLSMISLIGGFIFTTWFAGRIYRTGILMYGKKPSWKEMAKWAFRK